MRKGWQGAFAALFVCSWAGNQFSPLLLLYKELHGYSSFTVNAFLGVYVLARARAVAGRRTVGPVRPAAADDGRTVFAVTTSLVLALGEFGAAAVYAGRLLAGITVGVAMAAGTSWLKELSEVPFDTRASAGAGARRAAMAFAGGSAVGALVAGALAQWGPWPQVLPYLVHVLATLPMLLVVRRLPETSTQGASGRLWDDRRIPAAGHWRFRWVLLVAGPWIFVGAGLAYGYAPVLLQQQTKGLGIAYATLLTVVVSVSPRSSSRPRSDSTESTAHAGWPCPSSRSPRESPASPWYRPPASCGWASLPQRSVA